jgi:hypothetical protein
MKRKVLAGSFVILALAVGLVWAAAKPNFSGSWRLDTNRSVGLRQGMDIALTVKHEGEMLEIEAKTTVPQQPDVVQKDIYKLDGTETEFTPPQPPGAKGKRSGQWLARGNGFLINETITAPGPNNGPTVTTNVTRKWILSPDGSELTQDLYIDDARGSREVKRIFVKK